MILNFRTDRSGQTVQTQIRLLLEEQSDQGLHCLQFHLHFFDEIPEGLASLFEFKVDYSEVSCVQKFRKLRYANNEDADHSLYPHSLNIIVVVWHRTVQLYFQYPTFQDFLVFVGM